jgi:hypothetical protein
MTPKINGGDEGEERHADTQPAVTWTLLLAISPSTPCQHERGGEGRLRVTAHLHRDVVATVTS